MRWIFAAAVVALSTCTAQPVAAGPTFPDRGRAGVVDAAGVIPAAAERELNARVVAWDRQTGHQLVVVTVPSLQGYDVKDFGYQLGRAWGLGQKGQDDGAILLLAPTERKIRIEVGYGLEPVLTDAKSAEIIAQDVAPRLKTGDTAGGLTAGADRIMSTVYAAGRQAIARPVQPGDGGAWLWWLLGFLTLAGTAAIWRALVYHRAARALAAERAARRAALDDAASALQRFAEQSRSLGEPYQPRRPLTPTPPRITRTVGPVSGPTYAPDTYTAPPPPPPPSPRYDDDSSSSGSTDWGSSFGGGGSSDSGFDSGGGSFGGGGADSSY